MLLVEAKNAAVPVPKKSRLSGTPITEKENRTPGSVGISVDGLDDDDDVDGEEDIPRPRLSLPLSSPEDEDSDVGPAPTPSILPDEDEGHESTQGLGDGDGDDNFTLKSIEYGRRAIPQDRRGSRPSFGSIRMSDFHGVQDEDSGAGPGRMGKSMGLEDSIIFRNDDGVMGIGDDDEVELDNGSVSPSIEESYRG